MKHRQTQLLALFVVIAAVACAVGYSRFQTSRTAAEEARVAETAKAERARLLEQTRREIDMRLRVARRELTEHAAQLAVQVAEDRIRRSITPDDQIRLLDRYTAQISKEAR